MYRLDPGLELIADAGLDGGPIGLCTDPNSDFRLAGEGEGMCARVSIVRSDKDGLGFRIGRGVLNDGPSSLAETPWVHVPSAFGLAPLRAATSEVLCCDFDFPMLTTLSEGDFCCERPGATDLRAGLVDSGNAAFALN